MSAAASAQRSSRTASIHEAAGPAGTVLVTLVPSGAAGPGADGAGGGLSDDGGGPAKRPSAQPAQRARQKASVRDLRSLNEDPS